MARFKCENCGQTFTRHVSSSWDARNVNCPICGSSWVTYVGPDNHYFEKPDCFWEEKRHWRWDSSQYVRKPRQYWLNG